MEHTYINGDKVVYTGKSEMLHGDTAYEVIFVEGHRCDEIATTYRKPGEQFYNSKTATSNTITI